ncbi:hypothetical protein GQ457_02G034400 [Hibiscus cannabinus]
MWFIMIAAAVWYLWMACNDKVFRGKSVSNLEFLFQEKIRELIWIKAGNKDLVILDGDWWTHPEISLKEILRTIIVFVPRARNNFADSLAKSSAKRNGFFKASW